VTSHNNNNDDEYTYLVTYLAWPRQREYPPGGPGLGGLIHEKAHPCISQLIQSTLKCVDAGRINCSLVQQVPSRNDSIRKKVFTTVPRAPEFN